MADGGWRMTARGQVKRTIPARASDRFVDNVCEESVRRVDSFDVALFGRDSEGSRITTLNDAHHPSTIKFDAPACPKDPAPHTSALSIMPETLSKYTSSAESTTRESVRRWGRRRGTQHGGRMLDG